MPLRARPTRRTSTSSSCSRALARAHRTAAHAPCDRPALVSLRKKAVDMTRSIPEDYGDPKEALVPRRRTRASGVAERRRPSVDLCARRGAFSSVDESSWLGRHASVAVRERRKCKQCLHPDCRARRQVQSRRAGKDPSSEHDCISTASCPLLSSQLTAYLRTRISKSGLLANPASL
jgi:hypothetical protein